MYRTRTPTSGALKSSAHTPSQEIVRHVERTKHGVAAIVTLLEPLARSRVDAVVDGSYETVHTDCLPDTLRATGNRPVRAVLFSPSLLARHQMPDVDRLVTRCLGVTTVAIVSERSSAVSESLVRLGACGVQRVLDVTGRDGWSGLRSLMDDTGLDATPVIGGALIEVLDDVTDGTRRYFNALVRTAPRMPTVRAFTQAMGVHPSTFTSRFLRARLPSPKRYLAATRLLYASALLEMPMVSIGNVAHRLEFSSPQSFGRHVKAATGMSAGEFRRRHSFAGLLESYLSTLVVPFRETLRWFDPLGHGIVPEPGLPSQSSFSSVEVLAIPRRPAI